MRCSVSDRVIHCCLAVFCVFVRQWWSFFEGMEGKMPEYSTLPKKRSKNFLPNCKIRMEIPKKLCYTV